jgi:hypothetical protein
MSDPIKEHLKERARVNPARVDKLDDIRNEVNEMGNEVRHAVRASITEYQGHVERYRKNKNRALIGLGAGLVGYLIHPILGIAGLAYSGVKAYQAHQDKKAIRPNN